MMNDCRMPALVGCSKFGTRPGGGGNAPKPSHVVLVEPGGDRYNTIIIRKNFIRMQGGRSVAVHVRQVSTVGFESDISTRRDPE